MRVTALLNGPKFGELGKAYGWYFIRVAPNEQRVMKGALYQMWKPVREQLRDWWMFVIPTTGFYLLYDWAKKDHMRRRRMKDH